MKLNLIFALAVFACIALSNALPTHEDENFEGELERLANGDVVENSENAVSCDCRGGTCVRNNSTGKVECKCDPGFGLYESPGIYNKERFCKECKCGPMSTGCTFRPNFFYENKKCICKKDNADKGGKCVECRCKGPGTYDCSFVKQYYGGYAQTCRKLETCDESPCKNNGTCIKIPPFEYKCLCLDVYEGKNCEKRKHPCYSNPCQNGGSCMSMTPLKYNCYCREPYEGTNCEKVKNSCLAKPCKNGGKCYSGEGFDYICICPPNLQGKNCTEVDTPCSRNPCKNGGTCYNGEGPDYACLCPNSYTGKNCTDSIAKNPCLKEPCKNGGTCYRGEKSDYICVCPNGQTGKNCTEHDIDPCSTNPCQNDGNCTISSDGTYNCTCEKWFSGRKCENIKWCDEGPGKKICSLCPGGSCGFDFEKKIGYCTCPQENNKNIIPDNFKRWVY